MNYSIAPVVEPTRTTGTPVSTHAASYLILHHGNRALSEAVRHGMNAKLRGDEAAADFWCSVCSTLVRITQGQARLVS